MDKYDLARYCHRRVKDLGVNLIIENGWIGVKEGDSCPPDLLVSLTECSMEYKDLYNGGFFTKEDLMEAFAAGQSSSEASFVEWFNKYLKEKEQ